ncbi:anti-sigma regulatory factor (Ser/Thr protein kinase) [Spinactinospora alkalitolerans]|uniref:Anti-sigma regulatory factor (Ser/Thr protein kinase) n=1 Tax=Spinactinospora alkalitolerans TaxID=687207 RepID=A0A852TP12_9ACTN|nr:ATP-binding protein [Spinactinospora alkalitolerans]NYE46096.1 anti-sigma regulatory factor (Ser/Thr protein kinase) [Spinactinospora alkalitolerans]
MSESQRLQECAAADPFDAPALDTDELLGTATDHTVWSCVGNLTAVRSIRARVREFLERTGHPGSVQDDAELAVSELATNALLHSRSGQIGGVMTLFIRTDQDCVRIAVADQGEKTTETAEGGALREDGEDYGRGKLIIENCTSRSGEYWTDATHVAWFEID